MALDEQERKSPKHPDSQMKVHFFTRKKLPGVFSVEIFYQAISRSLQPEFNIRWIENSRPSKGAFKRLADAVRAARHQGDVNHVLGDVHYLTYFLRRRRTILTILDFVSVEHSTGLKRALLLFFWYWLPLRRVAAIVVISHATKDQLQRYLSCDPAKIHVIHCPVSEHFEPGSRLFDNARPRVLQIGTRPNKNLERHAAALEGLGCHLVVLGRVNREQELILRKHNIDYENHVDLSPSEVARLYQSSDILLFASTYEGFGLPIVEAQATGIPVITSNRWSMPEVAGNGAILVDPESTVEIRDALKRIIGDRELRSEIVSRGRENVQRFALSRIADQYGSLYRQVAGSSPVPPRR